MDNEAAQKARTVLVKLLTELGYHMKHSKEQPVMHLVWTPEFRRELIAEGWEAIDLLDNKE